MAHATNRVRFIGCMSLAPLAHMPAHCQDTVMQSLLKATLMHEFKRCPRRMGSDSKVAVVVGASKGVGLAVWSHAVVLPLHPIRTNMCASLHK